MKANGGTSEEATVLITGLPERFTRSHDAQDESTLREKAELLQFLALLVQDGEIKVMFR